jgi:MFS family permease
VFPLSPGRSIAVLAVAAVFCCITMATPLIHVVALASDRGLAPEAAARVLLVLFATGVLGRICFGRLADRTGPLPAYMLASLWQTALVYWFTRLHSPGAFYALAAVWGFGYAGVMTCLVYCAQHFVPAHRTGVATGVVGMCGWLGMGLGGWQGGVLFDLTGDYTQSFANAALAGIVNLSLLTLLLVARVRGQRALARAPAPSEA